MTLLTEKLSPLHNCPRGYKQNKIVQVRRMWLSHFVRDICAGAKHCRLFMVLFNMNAFVAEDAFAVEDRFSRSGLRARVLCVRSLSRESLREMAGWAPPMIAN